MIENVTKLMLEEKLESLWETLDCCKCDKCKEDILAIALNNLPAHYASTSSGEVYVRVKTLSAQYNLEILTALAKAIQIVSQKPNHQ